MLTWKSMSGAASRSFFNRSQGHSWRKRIDTSKVAPPHISIENTSEVPLNAAFVASAALSKSAVRIRVARRLWWASRHVVSVTRAFWCSRTAFARALGPSLRRMFLQ